MYIVHAFKCVCKCVCIISIYDIHSTHVYLVLFVYTVCLCMFVSISGRRQTHSSSPHASPAQTFLPSWEGLFTDCINSLTYQLPPHHPSPHYLMAQRLRRRRPSPPPPLLHRPPLPVDADDDEASLSTGLSERQRWRARSAARSPDATIVSRLQRTTAWSVCSSSSRRQTSRLYGF